MSRLPRVTASLYLACGSGRKDPRHGTRFLDHLSRTKATNSVERPNNALEPTARSVVSAAAQRERWADG